MKKIIVFGIFSHITQPYVAPFIAFPSTSPDLRQQHQQQLFNHFPLLKFPEVWIDFCSQFL